MLQVIHKVIYKGAHRDRRNTQLKMGIKARIHGFSCFLLIAFCLIGIGAVDASATTVLAFSDFKMAEQADVIVVGSVLSVHSELNEGMVRRRIRLQVYQSPKSSKQVADASDFSSTARAHLIGKVIDVFLPGGELGNGLSSRTSGAPEVNKGSIWGMYLEKGEEAGTYLPMGLSFGMLKGIRDVAGKIRLTRSLKDITIVSSKGQSLLKKEFLLNAVDADLWVEKIKVDMILAETLGNALDKEVLR